MMSEEEYNERERMVEKVPQQFHIFATNGCNLQEKCTKDQHNTMKLHNPVILVWLPKKYDSGYSQLIIHY